MSAAAVAKLADTDDREAEKMDAVGRLAGGFAHDLNNALTIILAHAEFLRRDGPDSEDWESDVGEIVEAAHRASQLARQLLAVGANQLLRPRLIDLNTFIRDLEPTLRRSAGGAIRVETRLDPRLPPVLVDPERLEQVILNLALNAIEAMPRGGALTISTAATPDTRVLRRRKHLGSCVALTVADSGSGMDARMISKAFEPFFTTKPLGQGSGLGLSAVYGIIKQSGGTVTLDSAPGGGTTVTAYLPVDR